MLYQKEEFGLYTVELVGISVEVRCEGELVKAIHSGNIPDSLRVYKDMRDNLKTFTDTYNQSIKRMLEV